MELDGGTTAVEGEWVDRVVGLDDVRVEVAFVRTPDGHGRLADEVPTTRARSRVELDRHLRRVGRT
jgi:hypothetical protein